MDELRGKTGASAQASPNQEAVPQRNPSKRTSTKPKPYKPYRVIRLTGEEARAISEGKLTVEAVKTVNPDRDDDIPERRAHDRGPDKTPSEKEEASGTYKSRGEDTHDPIEGRQIFHSRT